MASVASARGNPGTKATGFGEALPRAVNLITGPSRSADIEQTLIIGAHGARRLHVILGAHGPRAGCMSSWWG